MNSLDLMELQWTISKKGQKKGTEKGLKTEPKMDPKKIMLLNRGPVILQRRSSSAIGYDHDYAEDAAILSYLDRDSQAGKVDNRYGGYR